MEPEKQIKSDDQHLIAQKYRSESLIKWWVLLDVFCSWTAAYFLTFGISSLETTLLTLFEWDSAQFSYIVAATFLGAIIGPFTIPFVNAYSSSICTLLNNQLMLLFGESFLAISLGLLSLTNIRDFYILILVCRFIIGIGMGSTDSLAQYSVNYWFGQSKYSSQAFGLLIIGIEIGILSSRFALPALYNYSGNITIPFLASLLPVIIAIVLNKITRAKVNKSRTLHPEWFYDQQCSDGDIVAENIRHQIGQISFKMWLIISVVVIPNVVINTVYSCYVDPLVQTFSMTEDRADMLLSLCAVVVIIFNVPFSLFVGYIGGELYLVLIMSILMLLSSGLLSYAAICDPNNPNIFMYGVAGIGIFSLSLPFMSVAFALQAMESPPQFGALIASISTTLWWILSIFVANAIGWIYDSVGNYGYSMFVVFVLCSIQFVVALVLILVDKKEKGLLPLPN